MSRRGARRGGAWGFSGLATPKPTRAFRVGATVIVGRAPGFAPRKRSALSNNKGVERPKTYGVREGEDSPKSVPVCSTCYEPGFAFSYEEPRAMRSRQRDRAGRPQKCGSGACPVAHSWTLSCYTGPLLRNAGVRRVCGVRRVRRVCGWGAPRVRQVRSVCCKTF